MDKFGGIRLRIVGICTAGNGPHSVELLLITSMLSVSVDCPGFLFLGGALRVLSSLPVQRRPSVEMVIVIGIGVLLGPVHRADLVLRRAIQAIELEVGVL